MKKNSSVKKNVSRELCSHEFCSRVLFSSLSLDRSISLYRRSIAAYILHVPVMERGHRVEQVREHRAACLDCLERHQMVRHRVTRAHLFTDDRGGWFIRWLFEEKTGTDEKRCL